MPSQIDPQSVCLKQLGTKTLATQDQPTPSFLCWFVMLFLLVSLQSATQNRQEEFRILVSGGAEQPQAEMLFDSKVMGK